MLGKYLLYNVLIKYQPYKILKTYLPYNSLIKYSSYNSLIKYSPYIFLTKNQPYKMLRTYSSCNTLKKKYIHNFNCIFCKDSGLSICLNCDGIGKIYEDQKEYKCDHCFFGQTICFYCNGL
jgi:hypothetical protein